MHAEKHTGLQNSLVRFCLLVAAYLMLTLWELLQDDFILMIGMAAYQYLD